MRLVSSDSLAPVLRTYLPEITTCLSALVPEGEVHHVGPTALPGALTKGDVDVLLRVDAEDFPRAIDALRKRFAVMQPQNWTAVFASFGDETTYPFPLGVQVVIKDSEADFLLYLHDYFTADAAHLAAYNRVKTEALTRGCDDDYWQAKNRFLSEILERRPQRPE